MDVFLELITNDPTLRLIYQVARGGALVLDVLLLGFTVYACRELLKYKPKFVWFPPKWQRYVKTKKKKKPAAKGASPVVAAAWSKLQGRLKDPSPDVLRLAIIEADGIVDEVLKGMGLSGETFADRLSRLNPEQYLAIESLWEAHRIRNNLVHTPDYQVPTNKAEAALAAYEAFLKDAKAL